MRIEKVLRKHSPAQHLNPNVQGLGVSATVAINDLSNELRRQGREIFKLGLGESPFPVPAPVVEALRHAASKKHYLPVNGLLPLREAVAEHHRRHFGLDCDPDDVLIGPGSKELMFLLQLVYYGDLIIPSPSWVSYAPQAKIIGRDIHWLRTSFDDDWQLVAEDLEALCFADPDRARLLILNYPSNPTGRTLSPAQLRDLAEVAQKYGVLVLSDEIYGKLHHEGKHESIVPLYTEGAIFSGGLSKWCGAGGWRLGVFVFPPNLRWLLEAMANVASETFTCTSNPIQHAAVRAFQEGPEIEEYLLDQRRILKALGNVLTLKLKDAGARVLEPEGAFYLFPDFSPFAEDFRRRGIEDDRQMCEKLLAETGVAVLPGSAFRRDASELTARLAYVDFDGGAALEAAKRIPKHERLNESFLSEPCGRMLEAVDRIAAWATQGS